MTPSSDASEPVQNGNLSHGIEAAEAQVRLWSWPFWAAGVGFACDVLVEQPGAHLLPGAQLPAGRTQARSYLFVCVLPSTSPGPCVHHTLHVLNKYTYSLNQGFSG